MFDATSNPATGSNIIDYSSIKDTDRPNELVILVADTINACYQVIMKHSCDWKAFCLSIGLDTEGVVFNVIKLLLPGHSAAGAGWGVQVCVIKYNVKVKVSCKLSLLNRISTQSVILVRVLLLLSQRR